MRLADYVNLARERMAVVLAVVAVATVTVVGLSLVQAPEYVATVRLRARPPVPGSAATEIVRERQEQTDLGTEAELVRSSRVAARVAGEAGIGGNPDDLLDRVRVVVLPDTAILRVEVAADRPAEAVRLANAFAQAYLEVRRETLAAALDADAAQQSAKLATVLRRLGELDERLAGLPPGSTERATVQAERDQQLAELVVVRARLEALSDRSALSAGFGEVIQDASEARIARGTSPQRAGVFGVLIGLPLALAVVLLLDSLSNAVRTRQDAERYAGAEVLGVVPFDQGWTDETAARLVTSVQPFSPVAEAYRALGWTLARSAARTGASTILFTSPGDGDGKTATVANLALAAADGGRATRVVEADLRHPRLHAFFQAPREPGVADVLSNEVALDEALQHLGPGLDLLPAGRPTGRPDLLLARADVDAWLAALAGARGRPLRGKGRAPVAVAPALVLLDSAPLLQAAEVTHLASQVDGVVLVVRARVTSKQALGAAAEQVRRSGGTLLGVVLVGLRSVAEPAAAAVVEPARAPVAAADETSRAV